MIKDRRIGRFSITVPAINEMQDAVLELMLGLIVLEAASHVYSDSIEYIAISDQFDIVENGYIVPEYKVMLLPNTGQLIFEKKI